MNSLILLNIIQFIIPSVVSGNLFSQKIISDLNRANSIDEKFDILWKLPNVHNLTKRKDLNRNSKSEKLLEYLESYQPTDKHQKYELVQMFDKILTIHNQMKYVLRTDADTRQSILAKELKMRKVFDSIPERKEKMNYIQSSWNESYRDPHMYDIYLYFLADVEWQETYKSSSHSPAKDTFMNHYFSDEAIGILNDSKLDMTEKVESIYKVLPGIRYIDDHYERNLMYEMYQRYLESGTIYP